MTQSRLEVLKRHGRVQSTPFVRTALNSSMSFSFQIPSSMRNRNMTAESTQTPQVMNALSPKTDADDEETSWEDRDWTAPLPLPVPSMEKSLKTSTSVEWEEADRLDLPDDFPVLIVNLTRLRHEHFQSDHSDSYTVNLETEEEIRAFYMTVKQTLHLHFTRLMDLLFEQQICFHTSYGTQHSLRQHLQHRFPTDRFVLIDYPCEINGLALHQYLHVISSPTRYPSINYIKQCLLQCSRDLVWKMEIAIELERLGDQESQRKEREQAALGAEIEELTRLRDSFKSKLATCEKNRLYLLVRKLEDIETRLVVLLDEYLKEPEELNEVEINDLVLFLEMEHKRKEPFTQLKNVLDMVVAMIFTRLPHDSHVNETKEEYCERLLGYHLHIRRLWKKDFGKLPTSERSGGQEAESLHEEKEDEEPLHEEKIEEETCDALELDQKKEEEEEKELVLDGYGGDYDSAEDEDEVVHAVESFHLTDHSIQPTLSIHRHLQREEKDMRPTTIKTKKKKKKPALNSSTEQMYFSPYACIGGLNALRLAKENEGF